LCVAAVSRGAARPAPDCGQPPAVRLQLGAGPLHPDGEPGKLLRDQLLHARPQGAHTVSRPHAGLRTVMTAPV